ncbi:MAG: YitT family protein [Eubacteriales bacterium]|jgi:uncharacterized membrane-anchored protein YitT (DUF2179 family)|nr:YitT family protein [Eubacteriales bacterium]MDD4106219.1 YitT family protein [Eubacteriales bacterium]MDD4711582.1 YitT family protein [Eubacteriales bacterium]NLO15459.1 YitT family protein [Clostridiales bacterium]
MKNAGRSAQKWDGPIMVAAALLAAVGVYFFRFPNNFSFGGVTGIAVILGAWLPGISRTLMSNVMSIALLLVGILALGKSFGLKTGIYTLLFAGMMWALEALFPLTAPLTNEPFMELLIGVLLPSIGSAMLFNMGSSAGGTDIIAMIIKKYFRVNTGTAVLFADVTIALMAFVAFGVPTGIFSLFGLSIRAVMTDSVLTSLNQRKYFHIITTDPEPIQKFITENLHRSATLFDGEGAYTGENRTLILTVVSPRQAVELRNYVHELSPSNFLLITNTSEIIGRGFHSVF